MNESMSVLCSDWVIQHSLSSFCDNVRVFGPSNIGSRSTSRDTCQDIITGGHPYISNFTCIIIMLCIHPPNIRDSCRISLYMFVPRILPVHARIRRSSNHSWEVSGMKHYHPALQTMRGVANFRAYTPRHYGIYLKLFPIPCSLPQYLRVYPTMPEWPFN